MSAVVQEVLPRLVRSREHLETWPEPLPDFYGLSTREEAVITEHLLGELWRATPGAERWLAAQAPTSRAGKRRR